MNIFAFSHCPFTSALWLDDVRKTKMILEAAQMLSTAVRYNDPLTKLKVYKASYVNHPCSIWVRQSRSNFRWTLEWMIALNNLKPNEHSSMVLADLFWSYHDKGYFPKEELTPFANCARNLERGVDFSDVSDVHEAYRMYIIERWKETNIKLSWNWGQKPDWSI